MRGGQVGRRRALQILSALPSSGVISAQELAGEPSSRITPLQEIVNAFEVEVMARRKLPDAVYSSIAGGNRRFFERITFRPRLMVNTTKLDLSTELFGQKLFTPILVGPVWQQQQFHPEAEIATVRGATAARTPVVISSRTSVAFQKIVSEPNALLWFQVYPATDVKATIVQAQEAIAAGYKAICLTLGVPPPSNTGRQETPVGSAMGWKVVDQLRQSIKAPFLLKGVLSPQEAAAAVQRGVNGIIVSNNGGLLSPGLAEPIEMLPAIADSVKGKATLLIDGGIRRGTDILKALALGAQAVLLARPAMWGLAAYGSDGVRTVLELLQSELARNMALCGKPDLKSIDRSLVKVHSR